MLLGDVLNQLRDETFAAETLVGLGDLPLMVEVEEEAGRHGETAAFYASAAVRRFAAFASDDDWLALMTALERAPDPGVTCLRQMLGWSLKQDCGCCDHHHDESL